MESKRQQQFAKMIQRDLGEIFQQDAKHIFGKKFITVTQVRMTPDLGMARVYLSFLMVNDKEEALSEIEDYNKSIRNMLAQRIGKTVRVVPELEFFLDDSAEYAEKIERLLDGLDIPPEDQQQDDHEDQA